MTPIFTAFFTEHTIYEREAARLRSSLEKFSIEHDVVGVADRGSWAANAGQTAGFIQGQLIKHAGRPVVYLDADAFLWQFPQLFFDLDPADTDIAFHMRRGKELLNGSVWWANNQACKVLVDRYVELCKANPAHRDEQQFLRVAVDELNPRWTNIPASMCWIHDVMAADLGDATPIIEQLQCSREASNSSLLPNRRARLSYLGSLGLI